MATTSVWPIKKRLDHVLDYAMNPEKTSEHVRHDDVGNVLSYTTRDEKVAYITGVNCLPENAKEQMQMTKEAWNKTGGRLAYHGYQSFLPGETTPEQAHAIGVELARRMWGDRFQVVVATHIDQEHLHNHFVVNSVSFMDGKKYVHTKKDYYGGVRTLSDELCRKFGLSVIERPDGKGRFYKETVDEKAGRPTVRGLYMADVNEAIEKSLSFQSFVEYLEHKGYALKYGPRVKHIAIRPQGSEGYIRLYKLLGDAYEEQGIRAMLAGEIPIPQANPAPVEQNQSEPRPTPQHTRPRAFRMPQEHRRLTGIRAIYYKYLYMLGKAGKRKLPSRAAFLLRGDIAKFERYKKQFRFLHENRIGTETELAWYADALQAEIDVLVERRKPLYGLRRNAAPWEAAIYTAQIDALAKALRPLRRALRLCGQIQQDTPAIRAQTEKAVGQLEPAAREQRKRTQELRPKLGRSEHC